MWIPRARDALLTPDMHAAHDVAGDFSTDAGDLLGNAADGSCVVVRRFRAMERVVLRFRVADIVRMLAPLFCALQAFVCSSVGRYGQAADVGTLQRDQKRKAGFDASNADFAA